MKYHFNYISIAVLLFLLFNLGVTCAQDIHKQGLIYSLSHNISFNDSLLRKNPSSNSEKNKLHSPKKAIILSAVVPGAGQIYNKKYWKAPIVWAGLGACGYLIQYNHKLYKDYRNALLQRVNLGSTEPDKYIDLYSTDQLLTLQDQYRQNRDLFIIAGTVFYVINMVDALVDAHLFTFDVSDDLSLRWQPLYQYSPCAGGNAAISLNLRF